MKIISHHFPIIDSTNTWAKLHAEAFDRSAITLVTAEEQSAGRGRLNRHWLSPPKQNVYATYCFFLKKGRRDIGNLPQVAAVSIAQVLEVLDLQPLLKWPNDVLLNGKKIAGILTEAVSMEEDVCLIIGIGLNVNMSIEDLRIIDRPATSLQVETQQVFSVDEILGLLSAQFSRNIDRFLAESFAPFLPLYRAFLFSPDYPIQFHDNLHKHSGVIHSVNDDGSLNLLLSDNTIRKFYAGELL